MLNGDLYHDLACEFIVLKNKNEGLLNKFILSGNNSLSASKNVTKKVDIIEISRRGVQTIKWVSI